MLCVWDPGIPCSNSPKHVSGAPQRRSVRMVKWVMDSTEVSELAVPLRVGLGMNGEDKRNGLWAGPWATGVPHYEWHSEESNILKFECASYVIMKVHLLDQESKVHALFNRLLA